MTDKEKLIQAWTSGLADNAEMQLHAIGALDAVIDDKAEIPPALVTQFRHNPLGNHRKRWISLWVLVVLVLMGLAWQTYQMKGNKIIFHTYKSLTEFMPVQPEAPKISTKSAEETFLLYGNTSRSSQHEQQRALWEKDPTNAATYANYTRYFYKDSNVLPSDFLKIGAEIDPENAWYLEVAAGFRAYKACKQDKTVHPKSPVNDEDVAAASYEERRKLKNDVVRQYSVLNPAAMKETLEMWRLSLKLPLYNDYSMEMHQKRYPVLARRHDLVNDLPALTYLFSQPSVLLQHRYLHDVLVTALQTADMASDEGKGLFRDIDIYAEKVIERDAPILVDLLIERARLQSIYKQIDVIDTSHLASEIVQKWRLRKEKLRDLTHHIRESPSNIDFFKNHGSLLAALALPAISKQVQNPPPVTREDLAPMRYVDHCVAYKIIATLFCFVLLLLLPFHLWWKRGKLIHRIVDEAWHSIPLKVHSRLVVYGVVAPLCYYILLTVFTPLTGKDFSTGKGFIIPCYPAITIVLVMLLLPRLLVHRYVNAFQNLRTQRQSRFQMIGWLSIVLLLLPIHGLSWLMHHVQNVSIFAVIAIISVSPSVFWLLWSLFKGWVVSDFHKQIMHGLRRRMVGFSTICTLFFTMLTFCGLSYCETYWIQKDSLLAISPAKPTLHFEAEITRIGKEEIIRALQVSEP